MTTTLTHPADAVTNGATVIQASTFNVDTEDYFAVTYPATIKLRERIGALEGCPNNKAGDPPTDWQFFMRKDLANSSAAYRNLIGIRTISRTRGTTGFSGALGRNITVNVGVIRLEVHNWNPGVLTLTDGTILVIWTSNVVSYTIYVDPESGSFLYGHGNHRAITEAEAFILTKVAAGTPTNEGAVNASTGVSPYVFG